jgi:hypothetical protein
VHEAISSAAPPVAAPGTSAALAAPLPAWRRSLRLAATAFLATRLLVWLTGMGAAHWAGLSSRASDFDPAHITGGLLAAPGARWDSVWFLDIAHNGYPDVMHTAFFPLYPFLARAFGAPFGSALFGGLFVSFVAGIAALALLHRLAHLELGERAANAAVWLLATFPAAFFLSAVYSEALFLALSLGSVYAARVDRWWLAGALGGLAAATRSAGVLLLVALAALWWTHSERRPQDLAKLGLVPAGLLLYCVALSIGGLPARSPFDAQKLWFREFAYPLAGIVDGAEAAFEGARQLLSGSRSPIYFEQAGGDPYVAAGHNLQLFATLLALVPMLIGALRRLTPAYGLYALAALTLALSYPVGPEPLMSLPRFALVLFPLFLWLGWWAARGRARLPVLAGGFMGIQLIAVAEFATWHWVA